jgi:hypothetical protein
LKKLDFDRSSFNRLWIVLGALALTHNKRPTLHELTQLTGMPRSTTESILIKIQKGEVPGLILDRDGSIFIVKDWGKLISKKYVIDAYEKLLADKYKGK